MLKIIKKILKLLTPKERWQLYVLFGAMVFSAFIEVIGIASIMPFLFLFTNPRLIHENWILSQLYSVFNFQSVNSFLIFFGIVVFIVLAVGNLLISLTFWGVLRFSWMRDFTLSKRLLIKYLYQPYASFLNQNTSALGKNILFETNQVVKGVMIPVLQIATNGIIGLFIFVLLAVIDLKLAIAVIVVLGLAYAGIYRIVKHRLSYIGQRRFQTNAERFKSINEAFGGIKQIKLLGCEDLFIARYAQSSAEYAHHNATHEAISQIPRYLMELVAFGGVIAVILYLLVTGRDLQKIIPLLGLYVFAAYRLMPALQQIFSGITRVRFNIHALDAFYKDMQFFDEDRYRSSGNKKEIQPLVFQDSLKLAGITFGYPGASQPVLRDFDLAIKANTSVAFVGTTGAGKTTIADIVLGLLRPQEGKIFVDGAEITDDNLSRWQRNLGYIPQDIYLQDDTVAKNIAFGVMEKDIDIKKVERAAKIANIHDFVTGKLSLGYDTVIGERGVRLSGGQRQRIGIARALYHDPQVLVLDEATSALDGVTEQGVFAAFENIVRAKTFIIIAHRLTTVKGCDIVYMLEAGQITAQGTYEELMETNVNFRKMAKVHGQ